MSDLFDRVTKHDPAFPVTVEAGGSRVTDYGMSRRDYFAAAALTGLMSHRDITSWSNDDITGTVYRVADAMLAAGKVGS